MVTGPRPKKKSGIGFGHGCQAAIGRGVTPQFARPGAGSGRCVHDLGNTLFRSGIRRNDPMQLPQERQPGRRLAVEQDENDREIRAPSRGGRALRNIR